MKTESLFRITDGKGFQITLSNGYTISVQFGSENYSDNYRLSTEEVRKNRYLESSDAEIAMWGEDEKFFVFDEAGEKDFVTQMSGNLSADQVFSSMCKMAKLPPFMQEVDV